MDNLRPALGCHVKWRFVTQPDRIAARELYNHQAAPQEDTNLAAAQAELVHKLHEQLKAGRRGSPPPRR